MNNHTKRRKRPFRFILLTSVVLAVYSAWALGQPLAMIQPAATTLRLEATPVSNQLQWPIQGQAAVGATPSGVLATHTPQVPVPTASVAKVFTALVVLKKRPLALNETGPTITLTEADIKIYRDYVAGDGSVLPVVVGQQLTQYQMLQAVLLPSANNIADTLVIWAFGSLENYSAFANNYIRQLGLTNTVIGTDASGYSPTTTSTARDLVLLGQAALQEPVIAQIVGQTAAVLPVAGQINSRNILLGANGIIGIKTGTTDEAGGVFLAAKRISVGGKPMTMVSAIMGAETTYDAMIASLPLLKSVEANFTEATVLNDAIVVGQYATAWGSTITAATTQPLTARVWRGSQPTAEVQLSAISADSRADQSVGTVTLPLTAITSANSVPVKLTGSFSKPSVLWRLLHPF